MAVDWPLSNKEKQWHVNSLYERDLELMEVQFRREEARRLSLGSQVAYLESELTRSLSSQRHLVRHAPLSRASPAALTGVLTQRTLGRHRLYIVVLIVGFTCALRVWGASEQNVYGVTSPPSVVAYDDSFSIDLMPAALIEANAGRSFHEIEYPTLNPSDKVALDTFTSPSSSYIATPLPFTWEVGSKAEIVASKAIGSEDEILLPWWENDFSYQQSKVEQQFSIEWETEISEQSGVAREVVGSSSPLLESDFEAEESSSSVIKDDDGLRKRSALICGGLFCVLVAGVTALHTIWRTCKAENEVIICPEVVELSAEVAPPVRERMRWPSRLLLVPDEQRQAEKLSLRDLPKRPSHRRPRTATPDARCKIRSMYLVSGNCPQPYPFKSPRLREVAEREVAAAVARIADEEEAQGAHTEAQAFKRKACGGA